MIPLTQIEGIREQIGGMRARWKTDQRLKKERTESGSGEVSVASIDAQVKAAQQAMATVPEGEVMSVMPPAIDSLGRSSGFSLALQATIEDATYLFRHPGRLLRSLVLLPLVLPPVVTGPLLGRVLDRWLPLSPVRPTPVEPLGRLFDRFYRTGSAAHSTRGLGLGLSASPTLIAAQSAVDGERVSGDPGRIA